MAFKEMQQPLDVQKLNPAQRELTQNLVRIQQDRTLNNETRVQQSLDAVKGFVTKNPAEFTPQMAKGLATSLEAQVKYLEAHRADNTIGAISETFSYEMHSLGAKDAGILSANAVKISKNFQQVLRAAQDAAGYAGALSRQSDEQLGDKKGVYIEKLYTNLSKIVDLNLENRAAYQEMGLAADRSNVRAQEECRTGAAVTAGLVLTVVGMGAGGVLAHAVGHAVAHAGAGALATAGATVGTSAAAGAATAIAAEAAIVGIKEERLVTLGEMGSAAWKGAALGALAHLPVAELAKLAHASRGATIAAEATAVTGAVAVVTTVAEGAAVAAQETTMVVQTLSTLANTIESSVALAGRGGKLMATVSEAMEESHGKESEAARNEKSSFE